MNGDQPSTSGAHTGVAGAISTVLRVTGSIIAFLCALITLLWLVGRVCTDRCYWSQWLFWIPTPSLLPVILLGMLASLRPQLRSGLRRNRMARWVACGVGLLVYFSLIEHRLLRPAADITTARNTPGQVRLVHWNARM